MKLIVNLLLLATVYILGSGTHETTTLRQTRSLDVLEDSLTGKDVRVLFEDRKGRLWVGTRHSGLFLFNQGKVTHFNQDNGLLSNGVTKIIEDRDSHIWIAGGLGLSKFMDGECKKYPLEEIGLTGRVAFSVYEDGQNHIWCGAPGGAAKFDGEAWHVITEQDGLRHSVVHGIIEDRRRDSFWLATRKGGLNQLTNGKFEYHLSDVNCRELMIASNGDLWIGTGGAGAIKFDGKQFITYDDYHTVLPRHQDNHGNMWFATESNFVLRYDGKNWRTVAVASDVIVYDVIMLNNHLLIGTDHGIKALEE